MILWLTVFLLVAVAVQARQTSGYNTAGRVRVLQEQRQALESERSALERQIRLATSRKVLGARAEALGLHLPEDSEFLFLPLAPTAR